jgi:hypothetical protein
MAGIPGGAVCDRGDCPAPATCRALVHDQDFVFCAHHARELSDVLTFDAPSADPAAEDEEARRKEPGSPWPSRVR